MPPTNDDITNPPCYLDRVEIFGLWGDRDISLPFHRDVNIIIGPNASGKTTILNLLRYTLTADFPRLSQIGFTSATILLRRFDGKGQRQLRVEVVEKGFKVFISSRSYEIDLSAIRPRYVHQDTRRIAHRRHPDLVKALQELAPAVWLPVSRRLPIPEEEEEDFRLRRASPLESVDARLKDLLIELSRYRLGLEARLSERYKQFEKRVLQSILFSKHHDRFSSFNVESFTANEKEQLTRAFEAAGLLDSQMRRRIDEHFKEAAQAIERMAGRERRRNVNLDDVFIIPLIGRTKALTRYARELEEERESLFAPLRKYEQIVNTFLETKNVRVLDNGDMRIEVSSSQRRVSPDHLSSGEKQIIILLTQALLRENEPVIYVADEPELSLHVLWQEKLLTSLLDLGKQIQIIVATHSPDVVGRFTDKVVDLSKL